MQPDDATRYQRPDLPNRFTDVSADTTAGPDKSAYSPVRRCSERQTYVARPIGQALFRENAEGVLYPNKGTEKAIAPDLEHGGGRDRLTVRAVGEQGCRRGSDPARGRASTSSTILMRKRMER
jgi:hypothetical protein